MSSIKLASDALAVSPSGGELEYNGQFFGTDSNNSRAQMQRLVLETAKTASGTLVDFTGIPSWAKRITLMFNGVSTNGTSDHLVQIGSGSVQNSGYLGSSADGPTMAANSYTTGFGIRVGSAAATIYGTIVLNNISGNIWVASGSLARGNIATFIVTAGAVSLLGALDRVRLTTVNGTDTFDAGTINILYEG